MATLYKLEDHRKASPETLDKITRIKKSMERINKLMKELKDVKPEGTRDTETDKGNGISTKGPVDGL
jgi:hypothetical protein